MNHGIARILLSDQAYAAISRSLDEGRWQGEMPSELELCDELQVSRKTLRIALATLAEKGRIRLGGAGRHHHVAKPTQPALERRAVPGQIVRYLSPVPFEEIGNVSAQVFQSLSQSLANKGLQLVYEMHAGVFRRFSLRKMVRLAALPNTAGWILLGCTPEIQRWFSKAGIPCVVTGCLHPHVALPYVSFDHFAACRHAAHQFFSCGCRHAAFVVPSVRSAGEQFSVDGFLAAKSHSHSDATLSILEHDDTVAGVCRVLDQAMLGRSPPTAYLAIGGLELLTVLTHLLRRGCRIPEQVSIISRTDEVVLGNLVPAISHYRWDAKRMGIVAARLLLQQTGGSSRAPKPVILLPEFIAGESMRRLQSASGVKTGLAPGRM
jgi:DNA-binding LacI/PurR family transcriptional regulator